MCIRAHPCACMSMCKHACLYVNKDSCASGCASNNCLNAKAKFSTKHHGSIIHLDHCNAVAIIEGQYVNLHAILLGPVFQVICENIINTWRTGKFNKLQGKKENSN